MIPARPAPTSGRGRAAAEATDGRDTRACGVDACRVHNRSLSVAGTHRRACALAAPTPGPGVLDALALLAEVADELLVRTVRDTHSRGRPGPRPGRRPPAARPGARASTAASPRRVYGGLGAGPAARSRPGFERAGRDRRRPARSRSTPRGRFVSAAVNGLIGDRLRARAPASSRSRWPYDAAAATSRSTPRASRRRSPRRPAAWSSSSTACARTRRYWDRHRARASGTTYGETLAEQGWTPVFLRANTGLALRENGVALAALLQRPGRRVAGRGHAGSRWSATRWAGWSCAPPAPSSPTPTRPWSLLVTDVVTLGTPHLGAPLAAGVGTGRRGLSRLPETARRSAGSSTSARWACSTSSPGWPTTSAPLPHARYHLVAGHRSPARRGTRWARVVGDLLVRLPVGVRHATGAARSCSPAPTCCTLGRADHFDLLNHPRRARRAARAGWPSDPPDATAANPLVGEQGWLDPWKCRSLPARVARRDRTPAPRSRPS